MRNVYIYALFDTRLPEYVRYVGASIDPAKRLMTHERNGEATEAKRKWVKCLKENGVKVGMRILEIVPEHKALERESYWMMVHQSPFLLNITVKPDVRQAFIADEPTLAERIEKTEREAILEALIACKWKKSPASKILGISRPTLYAKMEKLGISDGDKSTD